jgi:hypothetical protein
MMCYSTVTNHTHEDVDMTDLSSIDLSSYKIAKKYTRIVHMTIVYLKNENADAAARVLSGTVRMGDRSAPELARLGRDLGLTSQADWIV